MNAYCLWNLAYMLEKYGLLFTTATYNLEAVKLLCAVSQPERANLNQAQVNALCDHAFRSLKEACAAADIQMLLPEIERLEFRLRPPGGVEPLSLRDLGTAVESLSARVKDELEGRLFLYVRPDRVPYYQGSALFGQVVSDKFPAASEDIEEAAKCFALDRYTASIFHLMRAMEVAVRELSAKLGISNQSREWGKLLSDINTKIQGMPMGAERNAWSESASLLYHVKQAWRNDVMHPKGTYTLEQAREVFAAVKSFMANLGTLL